MWYSIYQFLAYALRSIFSKKDHFTKEFIQNILKAKAKPSFQQKIDDLRDFYIENDFKIKKEDYGAGSKLKQDKKNFLSSKHLAKNVATAPKYGNVLHQLVAYCKVKKLIELGSSLGIGSAYMANAQVFSIEGNSDLAKLSSKTLQQFQLHSVEIINAQFDAVLPQLLSEQNDFQLLFIDGNHSYQATKNYFEMALPFLSENKIVVFDDIYWSKGMTKAWNEIKKHQKVQKSIDLYEFGIIFIGNTTQTTKHYTLWY